jgi:predicted  nucleic acid-binding Zn-ribbon protein
LSAVSLEPTAGAADARASAVPEERERAEQRYISELQHVRDQTTGNERHLLSRIEEAQDQLKRLKAERESELAASAKRIGMLESAALESARELSGLGNDIASARREAAVLREAGVVAEAAALRAREGLANDLSAKQEELNRAVAEGVRLRSELNKAVIERNEAIREAGRHDGRAAAFQGQVEEMSRKNVELALALAAIQKSAPPSQPQVPAR